jgi:hypothetical protein
MIVRVLRVVSVSPRIRSGPDASLRLRSLVAAPAPFRGSSLPGSLHRVVVELRGGVPLPRHDDGSLSTPLSPPSTCASVIGQEADLRTPTCERDRRPKPTDNGRIGSKPTCSQLGTWSRLGTWTQLASRASE